MNVDDFKEALLAIMEQKTHWSQHHFANGLVPRELFHVHLEQEYAVFIRDFPVLVGRAYVQCPIADVRKDLAANLFEEETGLLAAKRPHPELFLEIPRGFGFDLKRFENVALLRGSRLYRDILDRCTQNAGWEVAAAATTIFIEGTAWERGELDARHPRRPIPPLEKHPLHVHYNLPLWALALPAVHRDVEGGHRQAAWRMILDHIAAPARPRVVAAMQRCLEGWRWYKEDVATACQLERPTKKAAEKARTSSQKATHKAETTKKKTEPA
jgi:pyrroloquinoline-quinone synthase